MESAGNPIAMTAMQQGMLLGAMRRGPAFEFQQLVLMLAPDIDVIRLRDAWMITVKRHEILRSRVVVQGGAEPVLEVDQDVQLPFEIRSAPSLDAFLAEDRAVGIDVTRTPAFRLTLLELAGGELALVFCHHHLLLDGRGHRSLLKEVLDRYAGRTADADGGATPFRAHIAAYLARDRAAEKRHVLERLDGVEPCLVMPQLRDFTRGPARATVTELTRTLSLPGSFAAWGQVGALLHSAWAVLVGAYTRRSDVVFGSTRNGRHLVPGCEQSLGCFINTVPMRLTLEADTTVAQLLGACEASNREIRPVEHLSLGEVQSWLRLEQPLFDSIVVFERDSLETWLRRHAAATVLRGVRLEQRSSSPLLVAGIQERETLQVTLAFDDESVDERSVELMLERLVHVLDVMARDQALRVSQIDLLLERERAALPRWSAGPLDPARLPDGIGAMLREAASRAGDRIAYVEANGAEHSHGSLQRLTDAFAARLVSPGSQPERVVATVAPRSLAYLVAQLAAFEAGWTFVPIDPAWPEERIGDVLCAAGASLIIADDQELARRMSRRCEAAGLVPPEVFPIAAVTAGSSATGSSAWVGTPAAPLADRAAYVIFTSGSSGQPKGVRVSHRALAAHAAGAIEAYALSASDRVLQFASPGFDVALEESVPVLLAGGTLVERPEDLIEDLSAFVRFVEQRAVTILNLPSGYFHLLVQHLQGTHAVLPSCVRLVVIGSETPTAWSIEAFLGRHPHVRLFNAYGPTEGTITATVADLGELAVRGHAQLERCIGRPIGATAVAVVDLFGRPCPPQIPGELVLEGPQVALGYLDEPAGKSTAFLRRPDGTRAYRTGDLAAFDLSGQLRFLGRRDDQVKIRGVRIELAEIEQTLHRFEDLAEAAVVLRETSRDRDLVAFVVPKLGVALVADELRARIAARLPAGFVPAEIRVLSALPMRSSGKLDRRALVTLARESVPTARRLESPASDTEVFVLDVFVRLLGRNDIDVRDSFFALGGHSLLAVRLLGELNRVGQSHLSLAAVFTHPSVRELARLIGDRESAHLPSLIPLNSAAREPRDGAGVDADVRASVPVYFVCGVQLYASLARAMENDAPVFGMFVDLESEVILGKRRSLDVRIIAARYVEALEAHDRSRPCVVGGVSFGGLVAYEMAQQLQARGRRVELLVLLDSILPRAHRVRNLGSLLRRVLKRWSEATFGAPPRELLSRPGRHIRALLGRDPATNEPTEMGFMRDRAFAMAAQQYDRSILPYSGRTVIVRARRPISPGEASIDWDLGWADLVPHETPVFGVPGDHLGILAGDGAIEIARILRERLPSSSMTESTGNDSVLRKGVSDLRGSQAAKARKALGNWAAGAASLASWIPPI